MNWIKRNVLFVASLAVALVLMLIGGFLLFTSMSEASTLEEEFNTSVSNLQGIHNSPAHPGEGAINNINIARTNVQALQGFLAEAKPVFGGDSIQTNISEPEFKTILETTIFQLQGMAREKSITLPPDYSFTFAAQRGKLSFPAGSVPPWLMQLSDVRAITEILLNANVNGLENMRRAPVSADDKASTSELLPSAISTNESALSLPYEVTFRCFSEEFAAAMQGFVTSSNFLIVKNFSIKPAGAEAQDRNTAQPTGASPAGNFSRQTPPPVRGSAPPASRQLPGAPGSRPPSGLQTFLAEQQLLVTLQIDSVRLLSEEAAKPAGSRRRSAPASE